MAKLVETFQRLQKIETACMPKDDPAPVFLLDEILELARSSPEQAQAVAESIERKLASKSPIVKFKALRIIKHLCTKGCSTFQRCMQKQSGAVRELVHWRGEPDPFKGDVPNARVREFAKEVLEVLFNANPVASSAAASGSLAAQGRIQGFGSDGPGGAAPGRSSHSSGYGGGGGGGGGGGMGALAGAAASLEGPLAAGVATVAGAINDFLGNSGARTGLTGSRYGNTSPTRNGGGGGGYNNGGGGYGGFEPMGGYNGGGGGSSSSSAPRVTPSQVLGSEESVVDDVCAPGGLRPTPDAADLRRFVEASSAMDGLRLAEVLRAKMEGAGGWQVALRALCALEAVLQQGSSQAAGEVAVMFQSDPAPLQALATSPQALVRDAAARCLRQLLGEDAVPAAAPAAAASGGGGGKKGAAKPYATAAPAAAAPAADLLSLDDEAPTPAAAAAAAPTSALDLLGDLAGPPAPVAPPPAAAAAAAADPMFSGLDVGVAPAAQQTAAAVQDLFGGLSMSPEPPVAAAAVVRTAAGPPTVGQGAAPLLDDMFSGLGGGVSPGPTPSQQQPWQQTLGTSQQQPQQPQQPWGQQQQQAHVQPAVPMHSLGAVGGGLMMGGGGSPQKTSHGAVAQQHHFGGIGSMVGGLGAASAGPHTSGMGQGRGLVGGATAAAGVPGAAVQQQPWSGGLTKDHAAFDFVLDEFGKR